MFISERIFKSETGYILPVLLGDTRLNGISQIQGYLINKMPY